MRHPPSLVYGVQAPFTPASHGSGHVAHFGPGSLLFKVRNTAMSGPPISASFSFKSKIAQGRLAGLLPQVSPVRLLLFETRICAKSAAPTSPVPTNLPSQRLP